MNTPSAVRPAACSGCGWEAARKTGGARLIHGRCALAPPRVAGAPFNSVLMKVTPSASSFARDFGSPTFLVPLCPAPMPSTARPFETWSSEAIAAALIAGCRVSRLVTQSATRARRDARATMAADTQGSMAFPGVSNADHGIAVTVGALGELLAQVKGVGPKEETNL